jgi:hypothetical protein
MAARMADYRSPAANVVGTKTVRQKRSAIVSELIAAWAADRTPPGRFVMPYRRRGASGAAPAYCEAPLDRAHLEISTQLHTMAYDRRRTPKPNGDDAGNVEDEETGSGGGRGTVECDGAASLRPCAASAVPRSSSREVLVGDGVAAATGVTLEHDDDDVDDSSAAKGSNAYQEVQTLVVPHPHDFINQKGGESSLVASRRVGREGHGMA